MIKLIVVCVSALFLSGLFFETARAQDSQGEIARQLRQGDGRERGKALVTSRSIGSRRIGPELRAALIAALEREGRLHARRRSGEIGRLENSELIAGLANLVVEFRDASSIPALAGSLGTAPPVIFALADFGEPAAAPIMEVLRNSQDPSVEMDALIGLRLMVEGKSSRPLSAKSLLAMKVLAAQRLAETHMVTTLWRAIDLAVALDDPDLRRTVESFAVDSKAAVARGITDPDLIEDTRRLAADRLRGVLPLPRR
jgi:hypothetical protein